MIEQIIGGLIIGCVAEHVIDKNRVHHHYEKQVKFFDKYRALDVELGRIVGQGAGGVALLIKGMQVTHQHAGVAACLRGMRDYRNILGHVREKWKNIAAPTPELFAAQREVEKWVRKNYHEVQSLVYIGKKAFSKSNNGYNHKNNKKHHNSWGRR